MKKDNPFDKLSKSICVLDEMIYPKNLLGILNDLEKEKNTVFVPNFLGKDYVRLMVICDDCNLAKSDKYWEVKKDGRGDISTD